MNWKQISQEYHDEIVIPQALNKIKEILIWNQLLIEHTRIRIIIDDQVVKRKLNQEIAWGVYNSAMWGLLQKKGFTSTDYQIIFSQQKIRDHRNWDALK